MLSGQGLSPFYLLLSDLTRKIWQSPRAHTLSKSWPLYLWHTEITEDCKINLWGKLSGRGQKKFSQKKVSHRFHIMEDLHIQITGWSPTVLLLLVCADLTCFVECLIRTNLLCFAAPPTVWHWVKLPRQRLGDYVRHRVLLPGKVGPYLKVKTKKTSLSQKRSISEVLYLFTKAACCFCWNNKHSSPQKNRFICCSVDRMLYEYLDAFLVTLINCIKLKLF